MDQPATDFGSHLPGRLPIVLTALLVLAAMPRAVAEPDRLLPSAEEAEFRYTVEYPAVPYASARPADRVAALVARLGAGDREIPVDAGGSWLPGLLQALDIDPNSQVLVLSKTSLNKGGITPQTPRAIYFNDDTYVARVPGAGMLEIATMDPVLGPLFYVVEEKGQPTPVFDRQTVQCLRCHDSLTLTGGGVPRFILGSGYIDVRGELVSHEGWILTDQTTPYRFRWGGWYVTGTHGELEHLGNIVVRDPATLWELDKLRVYDRETLDGFIDTALYPRATSDIVALLVLEHQVHVQNLMTRVAWDVRQALGRAPDAGFITEETKSLIEASADPLVQALLFKGEPALPGPVRGNSGFRATFEARGPFDAGGRTLRELDLETRVFRYPLSYLVHSEAFAALPEPVREHVLRRLDAVLGAEPAAAPVARYTAAERAAARELLREWR
ncbi:MAG: hypothetical protein R3176_09775 [Woeseiaceae bacterium]|nr:hypothetical protein [Woeseiaceae bacterium]